MSAMILICPKCDSMDVRPTGWACTTHRCAKCGFRGEALQFKQGLSLSDPITEYFMYAEVEE